MSGGRWCYNQCSLGYEMFPGCDVTYGLGEHDYADSVRLARKINPLEDKQLSELAFDLLCVIYSADWYLSGDTGENSYRADVEYFKNKWLKANPSELVKMEIDKSITEVKEELYRSLLKQEAET